MKTSQFALAAFLIAFSALMCGPAAARGGHARFGVFIGGPAYWPGPYYYGPRYYYPPPYYYYPPPYAAPAAPPVYIEQSTAPAPAAAAAPDSNWWYYCAETDGYYPYVKQCAAGWQRVPPKPPS